ncbi:MAG: hypothetical protein OXB84_01150 [Halobacteriovoraceae bacterium]|nr:hypothetical protein [Halobacteriovoraceae bacterium]
MIKKKLFLCNLLFAILITDNSYGQDDFDLTTGLTVKEYRIISAMVLNGMDELPSVDRWRPIDFIIVADMIKAEELGYGHYLENSQWPVSDDLIRFARFIQRLNDLLDRNGCDNIHESTSGCYKPPTADEWEFSLKKTTYSFDNEEDAK